MTNEIRFHFDTKILWPAIGDAFKKLNPRLMVKNPVMFVTLVGVVISTVDLRVAMIAAKWRFTAGNP